MAMIKLRLAFIYTLLYIGAWGQMSAQPKDSLEVSLLTCSPGEEVYALYGHTAIRVKDYRQGQDWVFNYGMFSFNRPNFVWRFTRGECDYQIGATSFGAFEREYRERGSSVWQQVLNLTEEEKLRLYRLLVENMQPENRVYRYNFLYDNCTTRARDRIEEAVQGTIVYPASDTVRTYREIIHQYTAGHPWAETGNDICLGAEADRPITVRDEMFAPFYLLRYADGAFICNHSGAERPLVLSKTEIVQGHEGMVERDKSCCTPAFCAWLLCVMVLVLTVVERWKGYSFWALDALLMTLVGIIGLVVTFLFFFSVHPTVGSNWQIWVFNPLPLLVMPWVVWCGVKRKGTKYHVWNAVVLMFFIIFSVLIPQDFCVVVVPLALALWLRSCSYILSYRKNK